MRLARQGPEPRVDVGADHGWVARELGCVATERRPDRIAVHEGLWVVSDGLDAFGPLGTAVIAGMGARTIARIVERGPPVARLVLHAQDDPPALRGWLATHGYRIVDEALAPEAGRFAEVVVAEPGEEPSSGLELELGPVLLTGRDPLARPHFEELYGYFAGLARRTQGHPEAHARFAGRAAFLAAWLERAERR
ncbi:MAG: tRNA (adenine(22)-N(1))-methyltransferase TrmK [Alphaproteobacteria bacterium]|nr:tRNA (adenine(22)-N(1))-methyltransferase TrmK [Alphaproteobacteria bacterium]